MSPALVVAVKSTSTATVSRIKSVFYHINKAFVANASKALLFKVMREIITVSKLGDN
jgi:hypothetical protein